MCSCISGALSWFTDITRSMLKLTHVCVDAQQCIADPGGSGSQVELPICYSYCLSAELACGANAALAEASCQRAVTGGRVAPDRPDVQCVSCAARIAMRALLAALIATMAVLDI